MVERRSTHRAKKDNRPAGRGHLPVKPSSIQYGSAPCRPRRRLSISSPPAGSRHAASGRPESGAQRRSERLPGGNGVPIPIPIAIPMNQALAPAEAWRRVVPDPPVGLPGPGLSGSFTACNKSFKLHALLLPFVLKPFRLFAIGQTAPGPGAQSPHQIVQIAWRPIVRSARDMEQENAATLLEANNIARVFVRDGEHIIGVLSLLEVMAGALIARAGEG